MLRKKLINESIYINGYNNIQPTGCHIQRANGMVGDTIYINGYDIQYANGMAGDTPSASRSARLHAHRITWRSVKDWIGKGTVHGRSLVDSSVQETITNFINDNSGNYLEIGCFEGVTLSNIADLLKGKTIYGIDPFISDGHLGPEYPVNDDLPEQRKILYDNISTRKNIKFFEMTSEKFLKTQNVEEYDISTVFIDGSHTLDCILIDVDLALKVIGDKKGMVFFDDTHIPDVTNAINVFEKRLSAKNSKKKIIYQEVSSRGCAPRKYFIIQDREKNEKRI